MRGDVGVCRGGSGGGAGRTPLSLRFGFVPCGPRGSGGVAGTRGIGPVPGSIGWRAPGGVGTGPVRGCAFGSGGGVLRTGCRCG
jgi:hypothetical protein